MTLKGMELNGFGFLGGLGPEFALCEGRRPEGRSDVDEQLASARLFT